MSLWGTWGPPPPLSSQPWRWNILRCKKVGSDALTLAPGDPGGPRGPIGPCQSNRGKVRCCTGAIGSEMIVHVCVAYHGSRHRHGRRFVVVAMGHLRGEVLEEGEKERNKKLDPSVVWHRDTICDRMYSHMHSLTPNLVTFHASIWACSLIYCT